MHAWEAKHKLAKQKLLKFMDTLGREYKFFATKKNARKCIKRCKIDQ
jgi:hypothetical protein